ncbi:MAG: hypothetical protein JKY51_08215 [Opitutaceae bacterium]|nr:hypothetical protein [Opitutaceae bacterium]
MDNQEAKFILQAYRHGGQDADDPKFAKALERAKRGPELNKWFEKERARDRAISNKLKTIKAPTELREQLHAGLRFVQSPAWWQRPLFMGIAATLAVFIGITFAWPSNAAPTEFSQLRSNAIQYSSSFMNLDFQSKDLTSMKIWLEKNEAPIPRNLPINMEELSGMGCGKIGWRGQTVSIVCFKNFDLYVLSHSDCPDAPKGKTPIFYSKEGISIASWQDESQLYILVHKGSEDALRQFM